MADYKTFMILCRQQKSLAKEVKVCYNIWTDLNCINFEIKDEYSQSKILFRLEDKLDDKYHPHDSRDRKRMEKRCENLRRKIETRFAKEYPDATKATLEAHNLYLINKSKLNALRCAVCSYHSAVSDE